MAWLPATIASRSSIVARRIIGEGVTKERPGTQGAGSYDTRVTSSFERVGAKTLQTIIDGFVDEMVSDAMIGFFFRGVDVPRLKRREYAFTARFLGAEVEYDGRPIGRVHARHAIMGGQFDRRRQILKEHIERHNVAADITADWLAHVDRMRATITRDGPGVCTTPDFPLTEGTRFKIVDS